MARLLAPSPTLLVAPALLAGALALGGCETEPKQVALETKLADLREERQGILDRLYTEYGKGELAEAIQKETSENAAKRKEESVGKELLDAIGNAAGEVDRAAFDAHCETLGGGERPSVLSDRGRAFFAQPSTKKACRTVARHAAMIEALEGQLERAKTAAEMAP